MRLSIDNLHPTQCGLRHIDQVVNMVKFVRQGGTFSVEELQKFSKDKKAKSLIQARRFEDGNIFIHDGHHRCLSIWLAGRTHLLESEFQISDWLYSQYGEINLEVGYVTPHNPQKETRFADFGPFKMKAIKIAETSVAESIDFIKDNRDQFCEPRTCWHIKDLAQTCLIEAERE